MATRRRAWVRGAWARCGRGDGHRPLVIVAEVTPFRGAGIDLTGLEENLRYHDAAGVDGVLIAGTTGEVETLKSAERDELLRVAARGLAPDVIVISGVVAPPGDVAAVLADLERMAALGVDLALVSPPVAPAGARDEGGVADYFAALAADGALPVLVYHPPSFRAQPLASSTIAAIRAVPGLAGVKDSLGSAEILDLWLPSRSESFAVFVGNADLFLQRAAAVSGGILALASVQPEAWLEAAVRAGRGADLAPVRAATRVQRERFATGGLAELKEMMEESTLFGGEMRRRKP